MGAASSIGRAGPVAAAGCVTRPSPQAASCCSCPGRPQLAPGQLPQRRYGCRAMMLETVAAVLGMETDCIGNILLFLT